MTTQPTPPICRVCSTPMQPGSTLINGWYGSFDFGGDYGQPGTTWSEGPGDGKLKHCMKCPKCGHSFLVGEKPAVTG